MFCCILFFVSHIGLPECWSQLSTASESMCGKRLIVAWCWLQQQLLVCESLMYLLPIWLVRVRKLPLMWAKKAFSVQPKSQNNKLLRKKTQPARLSPHMSLWCSTVVVWSAESLQRLGRRLVCWHSSLYALTSPLSLSLCWPHSFKILPFFHFLILYSW